MKEISNNLHFTNININKSLIEQLYAENYNFKIVFITKLLNLLFPTSNISITDGPCDFYIFDSLKLKQIYLYNHIDNMLINSNNKYNEYIVFHTKMRNDSLTDRFINEILPSLKIFLENFKTSKTILILGEKNIESNFENDAHKVISLYKSLLLLNKHNNVIDLTVDEVINGVTNIDSFLYDIELINKAICNITFGIGGPFNMCISFSEKNISFIPFYALNKYKNILDEIMYIDNSLVENVKDLNDRLEYFIC